MGNNRKKNLDNTKRVTYEKQQKKKSSHEMKSTLNPTSNGVFKL